MGGDPDERMHKPRIAEATEGVGARSQSPQLGDGWGCRVLSSLPCCILGGPRPALSHPRKQSRAVPARRPRPVGWHQGCPASVLGRVGINSEQPVLPATQSPPSALRRQAAYNPDRSKMVKVQA